MGLRKGLGISERAAGYHGGFSGDELTGRCVGGTEILDGGATGW